MRYLSFFLFFFSVAFTHEYQIIPDTSDLKILTPAFENRKVLKIKLPNGLKAFLVSDPQLKESAAAMAINAGSWDDPKAYPGMAHFTEHMLFQGTKAYPERTDFFRFILDFNGNTNAFTAFDKTVYMFSINNQSFLEGLKRFSQFFIEPIFDPSAIASELYAVDQEYKLSLENDYRRIMQVWKETSNPNHPNNGFATGNSQTLSKIPREELLQWHKQHYTSENMCLVIYSADSLDQILANLVPLFEQIPSSPSLTKKPLPEISSESQKGSLIYIKPIKDLNKLILQWELPSQFIQDDSKSAELIAYYLNDGYQLSLLEALKKENLVNTLEADFETIGNSACIFEISIDLTEEGLQNYFLVIQKCFERISNLKNQGIPSYLFGELNTLSELTYLYQSYPDAFHYVSTVASDLLHEDFSSYPQKKIVATSFKPQTVQEILSYFQPQTCSIFVVTNPQKLNLTLDKKEPWMEIDYKIEKLSTQKQTLLLETTLNNPLLTPPANPFIPTNLSLIRDQADLSKKPIKIFDDQSGIGFYLKDTFKTPEISWTFNLKTPHFDGSARSYVLTDLFSKFLNDHINYLLLQAEQAGLSAQLSTLEDGFFLKISGYNDKAFLLFKNLITAVKNLSISKEQFDATKNFFLKIYENKKFDLPISQAYDEFNFILNNTIPPQREKLKTLKNINYKETQNFINTLFDKTYIECFFTGNLSVKEGETIWLEAQKILASSPYEQKNDLKKTIDLKTGPFTVNKRTNASGSGIILAIDENPFSFQRRAAQEILANGLQEPFFSEIRSKQKAAYFVRSFDLEKNKHLFQLFAVQSASLSPKELLYRFEFFIDNFINNLNTTIDQNRFETIKNNIIATLEIPPKNLDEYSLRYHKLAFDYQDFDWIEKRLKAFNELEYTDFIQIAQEFLSRENQKRLALLFNGKLEGKTNVNYTDISSKKLLKECEYTPN